MLPFENDIAANAALNIAQARLRPGLLKKFINVSCECGTPDRIRTYDPRLRRPMLYPAELRARIVYYSFETKKVHYNKREGERLLSLSILT